MPPTQLAPPAIMTIHKALYRPVARTSLSCRNSLQSSSLDQNCEWASSHAASEGSNNHRELFEYTSGRWIYNETRRLAEQRLVFNVDELEKAAAKSVNRPTSDIKSFHKIAEGGFNRIFDISLKDGSSILARIPYPSTLPRRLAVASEFATLAFARAHGIPTPRVLGYFIDDNHVGSEYILMEKIPGRPIGDAWFDLSEHERLKILPQIVQLEAKLFSIHLPASGSIYYPHDLSPNTPKIEIPGSNREFCIGPYAALRWWFGERGQLNIDRGPHDDPRLVLQSPAEKELAWIRAYGQPRFPFERAYKETFDYKKQDPQKHAKSLLDYIQLSTHLLTTCSRLKVPVLRHPDLQPNNIFVSEDLSITGLIDWQHSVVVPTLLAAGIPNSFQNYNNKMSASLVPPRLPDNFDIMDEDERADVREQFRRQYVHFLYLGFTQRMNKPHWHALEQETGLLKRRIFNDEGSPWEGLNAPLQTSIAQVLQDWPKIAPTNPDGTTTTCPVVLPEEEIQRRAALDESLREVDSEMERINGFLGIASDGWTSNEAFSKVKERAIMIKQEGLAAVDDDPWLKEMTDKHWPFDDDDEDK